LLISPGFCIVGRLNKSARAEIPRKTVYRLSQYLRCLQRLKSNGLQTVSSEALARAAGVKPTQLRKDLTYLGQFGTRGLGYDVVQLAEMITSHLGTNRLQPVVLVGFEPEGFEIVAAFDLDPDRHRDRDLRVPIHPMSKLAEVAGKKGIRMAILAVPAAAAQEVTNVLVEAGILGILNFAPIVPAVPEHVAISNVNLAIELENLSYFLQE